MRKASIFIFEKFLLYFCMDFKEIKGIKHYLYETIEEFNVFCPDIKVVASWRNGLEGEWAYTDDMFICQILKRSRLPHPGYKKPRTLIRTVCGSFIVEQKTHQILGDNGIAENIYAFSGNYSSIYDRQTNRKLNNREFLFAKYVAIGENKISAFKKAYPKAKDKNYIKHKSSSLLKKEEIRTMVTEEKKKILEEVGATPKFVIERLMTIADVSDRDSDRLNALRDLAKMLNLFDTEKKKEQLTVWAGFSDEQMEALKSGQKAKLLAHKEKEEK